MWPTSQQPTVICLMHESNKEAYRIEVWELYLRRVENSLSLKTTLSLIFWETIFYLLFTYPLLETVCNFDIIISF